MKEKRSLELVVEPSPRTDPAADPPLVKCQLRQNTDDITPLVPAVSGLISYDILVVRYSNSTRTFSLFAKHEAPHGAQKCLHVQPLESAPLPPPPSSVLIQLSPNFARLREAISWLSCCC